LEVFERRPQAAQFAPPSVIGRHPKTFTTADKSGIWPGTVCPLMTVVSTGRRNTQSGHWSGLALNGSVAFDPLRTLPGVGIIESQLKIRT
jgi:hypothetical protein